MERLTKTAATRHVVQVKPAPPEEKAWRKIAPTATSLSLLGKYQNHEVNLILQSR